MMEATARRVLHVVDVGSLDGGAQRLVLNLILNLPGCGLGARVLESRGRTARRVLRWHLGHRHLRLSALTSERVAADRGHRRRRVAVVHSHLPMSNFHGHLAAIATRTAHVGTLHGEGSGYSGRFIGFLSLGRRTGLSLVSVSAAAAMSIERLIGGCSIPYIYNGIDTDYFDRGTVATPEKVNPVIGCVGAFIETRARTFYCVPLRGSCTSIPQPPWHW